MDEILGAVLGEALEAADGELLGAALDHQLFENGFFLQKYAFLQTQPSRSFRNEQDVSLTPL